MTQMLATVLAPLTQIIQDSKDQSLRLIQDSKTHAENLVQTLATHQANAEQNTTARLTQGLQDAMDRIPAPAPPPTEKMPLAKPPPDVPSTDTVLKFTATEPDVTTRIASFTAMRDDAGTRTRTFAIRLADHFKAHILNIPAGGTHQFANAAARQAFAEMVHERIVQTCTAMFDWTDPANTRRSWQCPAIDMAGIPLAANQGMLTDMVQQSLTSVEDYVFRLLTSAIQPAARLQDHHAPVQDRCARQPGKHQCPWQRLPVLHGQDLQPSQMLRGTAALASQGQPACHW
jgi:hypothetical protein